MKSHTNLLIVVNLYLNHLSWFTTWIIRNTILQVQYYDLIKQHSGEDWRDAKPSLSTAQPSIGGSPPELTTRILRFKPLSESNVYSWNEQNLGSHILRLILVKRGDIKSGLCFSHTQQVAR